MRALLIRNRNKTARMGRLVPRGLDTTKCAPHDRTKAPRIARLGAAFTSAAHGAHECPEDWGRGAAMGSADNRARTKASSIGSWAAYSHTVGVSAAGRFA